MADGPDQSGMAADLARHAASRARDAGQWLGEREPVQVMDEIQSFARRRPGVFLALAAGAGLVAGRLTRVDAGSGDSEATARLDDEIPGPSAPVSDLPLASGDPVWQADPAYGEPDRRSPVTGQADVGTP